MLNASPLPPSLQIGCCITPHGLGHAARACAVMEALSRRMPVHYKIISTAPTWFFAESLTASDADDTGAHRGAPLQ